MVDVEKLRAQIPACQQVVYLNSGWSGPSPRRVVDAITARLEYESALGPTTAEVVASKQQLQEEATAEAAALLNASPDEIFLTQNTTEGINIVLSGLPWREGDEIVTCDLEHASVLVPAYHLRSRGVRVRGGDDPVLGAPDDQDGDLQFGDDSGLHPALGAGREHPVREGLE